MSEFIKELKTYRDILPTHVLKMLKGQALSGDVEGARKGLKKVMRYEKGLIQQRRICRSNSISST